MKSKTYKLNCKDLLVLVRYKHVEGDQKIPSAVVDLHVRWNETQNRTSPRCSPNNSDVEEEEDVDDEVGGEMGTTGLKFSGMTKVKTRVIIKNINVHSSLMPRFLVSTIPNASP